MVAIIFSSTVFLQLGQGIRINKIQNYNPRILRNTNLYTRTNRYYCIDSKIFSQPEFRNLSTPIKEPIACIQIQTGSLVLILVYIFNCLMPGPARSPQEWIKKPSFHSQTFTLRHFLEKYFEGQFHFYFDLQRI